MHRGSPSLDSTYVLAHGTQHKASQYAHRTNLFRLVSRVSQHIGHVAFGHVAFGRFSGFSLV